MDKGKVKYLVLGIVFLLVLSIGVSYSYWTAMIFGEGAPIDVTLDELKIVLNDATILSSDEVKPGWSISKTFSVENQSESIYSYNISIKDLINTFVSTGYLQYKITSVDGGYNMSEYSDVPKSSEKTHVTLAYGIEIEAGLTHNYTIEFRYKDASGEDQSMDMGKIFNGTLSIEEGTEDPSYLRGKILADHPTRPGSRPNLNSDIYQDENTGTLYTASGNQTENGETVYYFAGNALDNWVYFAGIYWRIIRTNEDGSVRLLYVGPDKNTEAGYIGKSAYNTNSNDPKYVGYMYGSSGSLANNRQNTTDSTIKGVIDTWYDSTIEPSYDGYVSKTAIYCNDRANEGYSISAAFNYAAYKRLVDAASPSYKCGNNASGSLYSGTNGADVADKFTASTSTGNGKLTNPVALMTVDEVVFAGGKVSSSATPYYYYNAVGGSVTGMAYWWTISPYHYSSTGFSAVFYVRAFNASGGSGYLHTVTSSSPERVRPVLSLKSCVKWKSGDGTSDNPYEVDIDSTCAEKDEKPKYNLSVNVTGGTVKPSNVIVPEGESRTFTVTANEGYTLDNPTITCTGGATTSMSGGALTIGDVMSSQTCTVTLKEKPKPLLKDQILADHSTRLERSSFSSVFIEDNTKTLYTVSGDKTEGGNTVYYFAGNALDNWVKFAGIYWRIIRINEDSSVRLLYVGADKNTQSGYISKSRYSVGFDGPRYAGYMYGSSTGSIANDRGNNNNSDIKDTIDTWYNSTIKSSYNGYISRTAIYCNDRANTGYSLSDTFDFAGYGRLIDRKSPSYKCGNNSSGSLLTGTNGASNLDKFTASTSTGNGKLTNPVALMTADEVVFAGGKFETNAPAYYYYNASGGNVSEREWWTMTPAYYLVGDYPSMFAVHGYTNAPGSLNERYVHDHNYVIRPVLSLKSCVKWKSGDGTSDNPYEVDTLDSTCEGLEN